MKKIGNGMRSYGLLLLFLSIAVSLSAQDENVQVETTLSESQVYEGERVSLGIVIKSNDSQNITRPDMPQVDGFRYASSYPSTSTSYSMMNGVSAMNYSFTWQLIATHEGVHQVPPVSVVINGETYETEPVTITVLNAQQRPDQQAMDQQPDVFLEMEVSDQSPVRGQQLIADLVIYFKREMDLSSYQVSQGWVTEGFWQEDLNENHSARAENVMVNGTRYRRAVLRKHALFPTRQGELKLQPYKIQANIRQNTRGGNTRDFFGGFRSSTRTMNLESDELTINVQDLPDAPNGLFINAVGDLNVSRSLSEQQIKLGESVEIVTEIAGNGNISLVTRPAYNFSSDFDVYRPQETTDLDTRSGRVSGKKVFRDVIIARRVGSYDIPETEVAIYDDVQRRYETVTLPGMSIDVIRDPNAQIGFVHDGRFNITPITGIVRWTSGERKQVYQYWWFWMGLILPVIIFGGAYQVKSHRDKLQYDGAFSRKQNALNKSRQSLKAARQSVSTDDLKTPYTYIHQALSDYITDSIGFPPSGHSDDELTGFIREKSGDDLATKVHFLLTKCSTIRFAPVNKTESVLTDIRSAGKLIESLDKYL